MEIINTTVIRRQRNCNAHKRHEKKLKLKSVSLGNTRPRLL